MPSGIITIYLKVRLVVRGFLNIYPKPRRLRTSMASCDVHRFC